MDHDTPTACTVFRISSPCVWQSHLTYLRDLDLSRSRVLKEEKVYSIPKDPLVCPKNPGFLGSNPMTWGWDVSTINPIGRGLDS